MLFASPFWNPPRPTVGIPLSHFFSFSFFFHFPLEKIAPGALRGGDLKATIARSWEHPAKRFTKILPFFSVTDRLGVVSAWAGQ
jgi:hypothetical protein